MVCCAVTKFVKPDRLSLKEHPELNARWIQDRIAEDPSLLELGELVLKDKEVAATACRSPRSPYSPMPTMT